MPPVIKRISSLPPETLLLIAENVVSASESRPIALAASNIITKTLLSLTLTSRIIYPTARRMLYAHCLYVDSPQRLEYLLRSLVCLPVPNTAQSLYLSPFTDSINDLGTAIRLRDLLYILAPILRRLVIDIPLRSLYPEDDETGVRPILRDAFSSLPVLEVFCSVRDELYLGLERPDPTEPVWRLWPNIKILALYNQDVTHESFWSCLGHLDNIDTVILTRADGLREDDDWRDRAKYCLRETRRLNVVFMNLEWQHENHTQGSPVTGDGIHVRWLNVPTSYYGDEDPIRLCQEWIKRRMLRSEPIHEWD